MYTSGLKDEINPKRYIKFICHKGIHLVWIYRAPTFKDHVVLLGGGESHVLLLGLVGKS